jgi:hypothetical protein
VPVDLVDPIQTDLPPGKSGHDRAHRSSVGSKVERTRIRGCYFLYHSPDDRVCPLRMAEQAEKDLKKNGAVVKLTTYQGRYGWRGNRYDNIRAGIEWMEKNHATRTKP